MAAYLFAFLAGILSILSPCVLPLLPVVLGAANSEHRYGPAALAAGLALSFTVIGVFIATIGFSLGLDQGVFRLLAAIIMIGLGLAMAVPAAQARLSLAGAPLADWSERRFGGFSTSGLSGQFGVGLLLGAVWSPCVGPTLGAASLLAARGSDIPAVVLTMLVFGIGAALPLVVLGLASRELMMRMRGRLLAGGAAAKTGLGILLVVVGLAILTGFDKVLETALVNASPLWLTDLTTRF